MNGLAASSFGLFLLLSSASVAAQVQVDVNRPRNAYECDLPHAIRWYGSEHRCLQELCTGRNVTNQWTFDRGGSRRRKNPCYGVSPQTFED